MYRFRHLAACGLITAAAFLGAPTATAQTDNPTYCGTDNADVVCTSAVSRTDPTQFF